MGQTLAQKIIARAAGRPAVSPGEIVTCAVDLAMVHDSSGPRRQAPRLEALGVGVWDPDRLVVVSDHFVPAVDAESARILDLTRKWCRDNGIKNFYDMQGICHVVLPERGHLKPGMFVAGGDSHSPTGGAFGAFMIGIGATEMTGVLVRGSIWVKTPHTVLVRCSGALPAGVTAKDIMLHLCARIGMNNNYKVIEYAGDTVAGLEMSQRLVLTNMAAELGGKTGIIDPDDKTLAAIRAAGADVDDDALDWRSDPDASYERVVEVDCAALAPQIAAPHSPENSAPVGDYSEAVHIDQAYIGACTGAKLSDLKMAAQVLKGRRIAAGTRLLVAPASVRATAEAAADGTLAAITEAGGILLPTGCGACAGYGAGVLAEGETCLSSTARNFKGRMGHATSRVYLGSPYAVAAAAVAGHIVDPREFLADAPATEFGEV